MTFCGLDGCEEEYRGAVLASVGVIPGDGESHQALLPLCSDHMMALTTCKNQLVGSGLPVTRYQPVDSI
jgi:hypothetical protein